MTMYPEDTKHKKTWICPRCGQGQYPPKAYHCPVCKIPLNVDYTIKYDYGAMKGYKDEFTRPDYNMTAKDEAPEYD